MSTNTAQDRAHTALDIRKALAARIMTGALDLPVLPGVAAEVLACSIDDGADAARLAQLIQQDQSLASHVLRIVNSPMFRAATEIVALRQAISRLGMSRIREIALSASLAGAVFKQDRFQPMADRAWKLALSAGLWSKEVARACRRNVEMAYLCGLLHNIGAPVVMNALAAVAPAHLPEADAERWVEEFAPGAGHLLARAWKLPEPVVATVEHIKDFGAAGAHTDSVAIAVGGVHIARLMSRGQLVATDVSASAAIQHLNLYPDHVAAILAAGDTVRQALECMSA